MYFFSTAIWLQIGNHFYFLGEQIGLVSIWPCDFTIPMFSFHTAHIDIVLSHNLSTLVYFYA
jgi:hypothetical protein